jgi:hypothetical protein
VGAGSGGEHGQGGGEERGGAQPGQSLADPQLVHPRSGGGHRLADRHQHRSTDQQPLAAEQVAEHAEGQFKHGDRKQEGIGDPGELGADGMQVGLEQAVECGRDGDADLREADGEAPGDQGAESQAADGRAGAGYRGVERRRCQLEIQSVFVCWGMRINDRAAYSGS